MDVITVSLGHRANHVLTQLNNLQEKYIAYNRNDKITHHNRVFLDSTKTPNGKTNYTPRLILFEHNGGLGAYWPFEFTEKKTNPMSLGFETIETTPKVVRSEYQNNLDQGVTDPSVLTTGNTKYWSDYNKLIYRPQALVSLNDWTHNGAYGTHRSFPQIEFRLFNQGSQVYEGKQDLRDTAMEEFRRALESCDYIQGVNLLTEADSGWLGFTTSLLIEMKDEFFNNGVNNKYNLWTYGVETRTGKGLDKISQIKAMVELLKQSTLYFPMKLESHRKMLNSTFDPSSLWHVSAVHALFMSTIWGLNNQENDQITMAQIENDLLVGYNDRNIVNEIKLGYKQDIMEVSNIDLANVNLNDITAKPEILLSKVLPNPRYFGRSVIASPDLDEDFKMSFVSQNSSLVSFYENHDIAAIMGVDTFPTILNREIKSVYSDFGQTSAYKDDLKDLRSIIKRCRLQSHLAIIEDKDELVEDISHLIDEYTMGYDESDEDFD